MAGLVHQGARRDTFVANLKKAARKAAAAGVGLVIEPINRRDIPGYFLNKLAEARAVIYEVGEPNLGLQFDLYHRQVEDGDVAVAIKEYAGLTRHYQIANPPDRGEPDEGDMNYRWLLQQIDASGYKGWVGCEYKPRRGTVEGLEVGRGLRREAGVMLSSRALVRRDPGLPQAPEQAATMDPGDKRRDDNKETA